MEVRAPGGGTWVVRRRWAPRMLGKEGPWRRFRRRTKGLASRAADGADAGCALDLGEGLVAGVLVALFVLVLVLFVGPALVAAVELLLVLLLAVAGVVGRVLFRRPWTVDALGPNGEHHEWRVVGWRASGDARTVVAQHLEATGTPPPPF